MAENRLINEDGIEKVNGGSWRVPEEKARIIGLELIKEDGVPGEFGYLWNSGDYYFKGKKLSEDELLDLLYFYDVEGHPAETLEQAKDYRKKGITWYGYL